jgi:hypothetical protein
MASQDYVPVAGDDWYQRRRDDAEGRFFRQVADQGPRKGEGGSTRQGIYCLTADGKLLAYKNAGQDADVMRQVLRDGLAAWRRLPAERRRPGAVPVPDAGEQDRQFSRTLPPGGYVVAVSTRVLEQDGQGQLQSCPRSGGPGTAAARDHLWLSREEGEALIPAHARKGQRLALPPAVAFRILCYHLVDNTRGEPPHWGRDQVRAHELTLTVEEATPARVRLRLEGTALLATDPQPDRAARGYDVHLLGYLEGNPAQQKLERFDLVALGNHWGHGTYNGGERRGRTPLGVAFELVPADVPANRVPPQGARNWQEYLGRQ